MKISGWKAGLFAAVAVMSATPALADDEGPWGPFSATIGLTSDYRFRGISQTATDPAVQGSIDFAKGGFFAGAWASNLDFEDPQDTSVEVDLYAGYTHAFSETTEGTLKVVYYWYPDSDPADYDYFEIIGSLGHDFGKFSGGVELAYSPDFFNETGDAFALTGNVGVPLVDSFWFFDGGLAASAHLGYQWIDQGYDYMYWDAGLTATAGIFAFSVQYVDTDLEDFECGFTNWCDATVVASVLVSLPGE